MLACPDKAGTDVPMASLEVGRRLLEPLYAAHVDGLQCFLGVSCAPALCSHCLCLSASFWDWKQRVAHEDPRCAWHVRTLPRAA